MTPLQWLRRPLSWIREARIRGVPIRLYLPLVLGALVLISVAPVVLLGWLGARDNTGRLLRDRTELVLDAIVDPLRGHLEPIELQLAFLAELVTRGSLDPTSEKAMTAHLAGALAATPQVVSLGHLRLDGTLVRIDREAGSGRVEDWRQRYKPLGDALRHGSEQAAPGWLGPIWSVIQKEPILVRRHPLHDEGGFAGVLIAAITLSELSRLLESFGQGLEVQPFVLAGRDRVIAHPRFAVARPRLGPGHPLPGVEEVDDPVLAAIWTAEPNEMGAHALPRSWQGHWSWIGASSHGFYWREIDGYGDRPWLVGMHAPGTETRRERWVVTGIAIGGGVLLLIALVDAYLIGRRLGRPVVALAAAADRIEALDVEAVRNLPRGPISEINLAAGAFERMAATLRTVERYLPRQLVRRLLAAGTDTPPSAIREVTLMFTDLEGYTAFANGRSAEEVRGFLNEVFGLVGPIVEASGGTIDKYMGDGFMAFWGAPEPMPEHVLAAARAAVLIAERYSAWCEARRADGLPCCCLRVGLHTGPVLAGNIGFAGRLDYTVVGEPVNIAKRVQEAGRRHNRGDALVTVSATVALALGTSLPALPRPDLDGPPGHALFELPANGQDSCERQAPGAPGERVT